jgi:hypothetical protein
VALDERTACGLHHHLAAVPRENVEVRVDLVHPARNAEDRVVDFLLTG